MQCDDSRIFRRFRQFDHFLHFGFDVTGICFFVLTDSQLFLMHILQHEIQTGLFALITAPVMTQSEDWIVTYITDDMWSAAIGLLIPVAVSIRFLP